MHAGTGFQPPLPAESAVLTSTPKKKVNQQQLTDHKIQLNKLYHYGIREIVFDWFASYLKDRSQITIVSDTMSSETRFHYGVG